MKTNYWLRCKKCGVSTVLYSPTKEQLKIGRREFLEEHKECKKGGK